MIDKKQTFKLGRAELRFDPKDTHVILKIGERMARVKKTELWMVVFAISREKDQDDLIPAMKKDMMSFDRVHTIKATKDIKEGEIVKFHCHTDVPLTILNSLINKETWEEAKKALNEAQALIPTHVIPEAVKEGV